MNKNEAPFESVPDSARNAKPVSYGRWTVLFGFLLDNGTAFMPENEDSRRALNTMRVQVHKKIPTKICRSRKTEYKGVVGRVIWFEDKE